jgi:ribonuclease E
MSKKIVISEKDNIGIVLQNSKAVEIFAHKGDVLLGDVYLARVDNILPSIEAAFVDVGLDKMGFIHTNDLMGKGNLKDKVKPKQKIIAQVVKEPTGHKGPSMTTALSLPGRFLVLLPDEIGINVSKKITSPKERARLKAIVSLFKPVGVGIIVRTEAQGQSESEIQEDIEILLEKWNSIVTTADTVESPTLLHRDQDLLYRIIREACSDDVDEIIVDSSFSLHRTTQLLQHWNMLNKTKVTLYKGNDPILIHYNIHKEINAALQTKVNLPLGGYLYIQQTEALTVIDVNSGKFVSSSSQAETILKTNLQAADEIARQLKLRNIGGMIVIDFIDMTSRMDKLALLEHFELALETDKAKPQIGQLSDLGLVELTRHRQGQSLSEIFTKKCDSCSGSGFVIEDFKFASSTALGEAKAKINKIKGPFTPAFNGQNNQAQGQKNNFKKGRKQKRNIPNQQEAPKNMENETMQNQPKEEIPKTPVLAEENKAQNIEKPKHQRSNKKSQKTVEEVTNKVLKAVASEEPQNNEDDKTKKPKARVVRKQKREVVANEV